MFVLLDFYGDSLNLEKGYQLLEIIHACLSTKSSYVSKVPEAFPTSNS